jgi:hypothetical protein
MNVTSAEYLDYCINRPPFHLKEWCHDKTVSLTNVIATLLNLPIPSDDLLCKSYVDLHTKVHELFQFWQCSILIVHYCKNNVIECGKYRSKKRRQYANCYYQTLAYIGEDDFASTVVHKRLDYVLCLHADNRLGILSDEHRIALMERYKDNARQECVGKNINYQGIPVVSLEQAREAVARREQKLRAMKIKKYQKEKELAGADARNLLSRPPPREIGKLCKCEICISEKYDGNMSKAGPERLCTVPLDITDLLQMIGADSLENLKIVERLCELSFAAMDIESMTVTTHMETPESVLEYAPIDNVAMGGFIKKVQKPIMISHIDCLLYEESSIHTSDDRKKDLLTFTAESDSEVDIFKMMKFYWKAVLKRKELIMEEKKKIAEPLMALIRQYDQAHIQFFRYWQLSRCSQEDLKAVGDVWFQSIPGKLQKALSILIAQYEVFSFYG